MAPAISNDQPESAIIAVDLWFPYSLRDTVCAKWQHTLAHSAILPRLSSNAEELLSMPNSAVSAVVRLHPDDSVVVAMRDIAAGEAIEAGAVIAREPVPRGHKIAVRPVERGRLSCRIREVTRCRTAPAFPPAAPGPHLLLPRVLP